jgi:cyclophilin family peptidyl-prolyl cis-trans isomerase
VAVARIDVGAFTSSLCATPRERTIMTKFEPLAIGERGKDRANPTAAERRLLMEKFTRTGAHPELERDDEDVARRARVKKTTRSDAMRAKAFLDIEVAGAPAGSVVIEMLEDAAPKAARRFEARLDEGDDDGVCYRDSCVVSRVDDELRVVFAPKRLEKRTKTLETEGDLTHACAGVVGADRTSGEFSITTHACESLDASSQVVGRVVSGLEILKAFTHREKGAQVPNDIRVSACGVVRGGADVETLVGVAAKGRAEAAAKARAAALALKNETKDDTLKRLRAESAAKGKEIEEMVRTSHAKKTKTNDDAPRRKGGMLDSMLDDSSSDSE